MRLVFRADASPDLGTGHVMRCSSIAEEALARDIPCIFVGSMGGIRWIEERLAFLGIPVISVSDFNDFTKSDLLIIDSYLQGTQEEFIKCNIWASIVVIVDEVTPIPEADLFIHPGLVGAWFRGDRKKFVCGPKFIPLRKTIQKSKPSIGGLVEKIVVFGGGTDAFGFAQEMSRILSDISEFNRASFFSSEYLQIEKKDSRFRGFQFGGLLDLELSQADLVFTTASTSSLEIVAREIPLGIACSVENQQAYYEELRDSRVAVQIGYRTKTGTWEMDPKTILELISNSGIRTKLSMASNSFIDLDGASRIMDKIEEI